MIASVASVFGDIIFGGIGLLVAAGFIVGSINKSIQRFQGKNICRFCRKRLKASGGTYATVCSHCGRSQAV